MLREQIFAAFLAVATPGTSPYSRVDVPACDVGDCSTPILALTGFRPEPSYRFLNASWTSWSRQETRPEALNRWASISAALAAVLEDPPPAWKDEWSRVALGRGLVTIARHESALWRSVGEGRLIGQAGEVCYVQIHPSNLDRLGVRGDDLVGLDRSSTENCFRAGATILANSTRRCGVEPIETDDWDAGVSWFGEAISMYGHGSLCTVKADWVESRVRMYSRLSTQWVAPLPPDAALALHFVDESWMLPPVPPAAAHDAVPDGRAVPVHGDADLAPAHGTLVPERRDGLAPSDRQALGPS